LTAARSTRALLLEDSRRGVGVGVGVGGGIAIWSGGIIVMLGDAIDKSYKAELSFREKGALATNKDDLRGAAGASSLQGVSSVLDSTISDTELCGGEAHRRPVAVPAAAF
jgi:hypothetical protein